MATRTVTIEIPEQPNDEDAFGNGVHTGDFSGWRVLGSEAYTDEGGTHHPDTRYWQRFVNGRVTDDTRPYSDELSPDFAELL